MEWYLFLYTYSIMHDLHDMSADMHSSYEIEHLITVSYRKNPLYYCNTCVAYTSSNYYSVKMHGFILYNLYIGVSIPSKWAEVEEGSALLKPVVPTFPVN